MVILNPTKLIIKIYYHSATYHSVCGQWTWSVEWPMDVLCSPPDNTASLVAM